MSAREGLRRQLLDDLDRLRALALLYAHGDRSVKRERDQLEGAVQVKLALLRRTGTEPDQCRERHKVPIAAQLTPCVLRGVWLSMGASAARTTDPREGRPPIAR